MARVLDFTYSNDRLGYKAFCICHLILRLDLREVEKYNIQAIAGNFITVVIKIVYVVACIAHFTTLHFITHSIFYCKSLICIECFSGF